MLRVGDLWWVLRAIRRAIFRGQLVAYAGLATALLAAAVPARADAAEFTIRDEWSPISGVIVSTRTNEEGKEEVNPLAKEVIRYALQQNLKVIVADRAAEAAIKAQLAGVASAEMIKNRVMVINAPLANDWARDTAPIIRFNKDGSANVTTTHSELWSLEQAKKARTRIAAALGDLTTNAVPTVDILTFAEKKPIRADGGSWVTTTLDEKKILFGTVKDLYYENSANAPTVNSVLKSHYGIDQVIILTPINEDEVQEPGYAPLANNHLDLQIRTLPNGHVIVADVAAGDPFKEELDAIAAALTSHNFNVTRLLNSNAIVEFDEDGNFLKHYAPYTNALFLNNTVLIPSYGDGATDAAAVAEYNRILNLSEPKPATPYNIIAVDASQAIRACGALRCAAREIPLLPSAPEAKEASSHNNPHISFDAATGALSFTAGVINFLGDAGAATSDPAFALDLFAGAILEVSGLGFEQGMSEGQQFAFTGGELTVHKDGMELMSADIPVFAINGIWPTDALNMAGILANVTGPEPGESAWFDAFWTEVLDSPSLVADFFAISPIDLIALSNEFSESFGDVELVRMGVVGNGTPLSSKIPEPGSLLLLSTIVCAVVFCGRPRHARA